MHNRAAGDGQTEARSLGAAIKAGAAFVMANELLRALAGGLVAAQAGVESALILVAISFALSTVVIVMSPRARLRAMPSLASAGT